MAYNKKNKAEAKRKQELLEGLLENYTVAKDYCEEDYQRNEEDNKFALGEQWDEKLKNERKTQNRPSLVENTLLPYVNKVINEIRQSRPRIHPKPVDGDADIKTAEILQGIIRNIEMQSDAETAYDTAAGNAVKAGYGWLRVNTKYADEESFDQELVIERILNPFSVLFDPASQRLDGADGDYAFISEDMDKKMFERLYPDAKSDGFDVGAVGAEWLSKDKIRVVEYYYKEHEDKTLYQFEYNGEVYEGYELPEGIEAIQDREVVETKIKYCKATANEILEETDFLGSHIPIVPVIGLETWLNGKRQIFSLIHQAKDPQKMLNYWKSASAEIIALQPKAPYIGAIGQFSANAEQWRTANTVNRSFMEYEPRTVDGQLVPPPQRQPFITNTGNLMQEAMTAKDGIKSSLGMYDASMGQQSADISGKAIIQRQVQGDTANFHFIDNLSTAMKHVGRILVELIPLVYRGKRIVRILGEDGEESVIPLGQPVIKEGKNYRTPEMGEQPTDYFQINQGKYDVNIEVGSGFATKRQEAADALIKLASANPQYGAATADLMVKSLDIPFAEEIAKRIKAVMPPEVLGDDPLAQRIQKLAEELQATQEKLSQTELALEVKQEDFKFEQTYKMGQLNNETQKVKNDTLESAARAKKLEAEATQAIPAEAVKDMMEAQATAGAELEESVEFIMQRLEELTPERVDEATGEPTNTPE